ncbi:MAG TPA: hypothetical protein VM262_06015 [Acidimicrobiales bacterium]|nr:hypothetical protein [Acidimicrobiales bacterium]
MELPEGIEPDQVKVAAIVAIAVVVLGAFLVLRFIQKLILKLVIVLALVGAGVFLYAQRDSLDDCQQRVRASLGRDCVCGFAGFDVTVPGCTAVSRP